MRRLLFLILSAVMLFSTASCKGGGIPEIEYSESVSIFSGSMGKSVITEDSEIVKAITDEVNSLELQNGRRDNTDGFSFEISWLDENGETIEAIRIYGEGEIGYGKKIYEADCRGLLGILAGVPMPL